MALPESETKNEVHAATPKFSLTDVGNADRFLHHHGKNLLYCHDLGCWLVWKGDRWQPDGIKEVESMALTTVRSIYLETAQESSPDKIQEILRWAKTSHSGGKIREMVRLAQIDKRVSVSSTFLDRDPFLLNVANGTIDLSAERFIKHSRTDLQTKLVPVEYHPSATCDYWDEFLLQIFGNDEQLIHWVQKAVGYSLSGDTSEQCMFILWGAGRNGKSTFLNTIKQILGDYTTQIQPETLMVRRNNDGGSPRSDLMALRGARFVTASEGEKGQQLAESLVKQLTGGEVISARGLYQKNQIEILPTFKLFFATNYKPQIAGTDLGIWRRIRLIPFNYTIPPEKVDHDLQRKLMGEASGILRWMVDGYYAWQREGLGVPKSVETATNAYLVENDQVERFIADCCVRKDGCQTKTGSLYGAYQQWARDSEDNQMNLKAFGHALSDKGFKKKRRADGVLITGLGLLDEFD
ncbi:hypothetical protein KP001_08585 [Geomonas subterranea]|uniref:SF3 helicase domain-containing protein n=1 Tax=Geomonas subterranea TaxID=2847989 RepID=A0ABX8LL01_9BACT|nr:phage/plasmid primase, P4 family [Geomonas subterranea]QXE92557.1 hypothetical protein KP001_08585 [Geomonas subterranea]QXM09345.1 hypothetical protein KP002_20690 [Geomonas subterranea]